MVGGSKVRPPGHLTGASIKDMVQPCMKIGGGNFHLRANRSLAGRVVEEMVHPDQVGGGSRDNQVRTSFGSRI